MASWLERTWIQRLLVMLVPALVTLPRFANGFVFDDVFVIARGEFIHDLHNLSRVLTTHAMAASSMEGAVGNVPLDTFRPLSIASFFWDSAISGRSPWAYHLTNLTLHAANCLLMLELLRTMCWRAAPSLWLGMTLCFGLAPWLSEAHVFINGRSDLFIALFALPAVLLQRAALEQARVPAAMLAGLLALLALLSKETAVLMLPLLVLVPTEHRIGLRKRALYALPQVTAFAVYMWMRTHALDGLRTHADNQHLLHALANVPLLWADTVVHSLLPLPYRLRNLRDDYAALGMGMRSLAVVLLLLTFLGLAAALRGRRMKRAWALSMALATTAPAVMITTELWQGFGRYLYLPAVGLFLLCCDSLSDLPFPTERARTWVHGCVYLLAALSGVLLIDSTLGFRDDALLYRRALAEAPEQAWTHGSLGLSLKRAGDCPAAIPHLMQAAAMEAGEPRYAVHLAYCLVDIGNFERARQVARAGQQRFRDTRAEPGFLVAEFLTWPRGTPHLRELMERCLRLDPRRTDCQEGLAALQQDSTR